MKMMLSELRAHIATLLTEVNLWDHEYVYDPRRDSVGDLAKAALRWYHFDKNHEKWVSSSDERFLMKLRARLASLGVNEHEVTKVLGALSSPSSSSAAA